MLWLYRFLHVVLAPFLAIYLVYRRLRGREDATRLAERKGIASQPRPTGPLVWVHGASVGEVMSVFPVLHHLRRARPHLNLLLTTGTLTGMRTLQKFSPALPGTGTTVCQYIPIDTPWATARFLSHWAPTVSVFTESDFWPELLAKAPNPILLNGRISDRSYPKYQRYKFFFKPLLGRFTHILAQWSEDAHRLRTLGAPNVQVGGNLKFDAAPLPADPATLEKMQGLLAGRPTVVYASTHPGEEEQIAHIHTALRTHVPDLLTIIVPRHPHRGTQAANEVLRVFKTGSRTMVHRRGLGEQPKSSGQNRTEIYIADTLGELGLWYRLAGVVVMGKSLAKPGGGQNPLEPLKLGAPTLTGPYMTNFQDMLPALTQSGVLTVCKDLPTLTQTLRTLLADDTRRATLHKHIVKTIPSFGGASTTAAQLILSQLPPEA